MSAQTPPPTQTASPHAVTGYACIQSYLKTLDNSPGVYRMLDEQSRVLYVGKARNLRARVSNYARPTGHSARIARMIRETAAMTFLTTRLPKIMLILRSKNIVAPKRKKAPISAPSPVRVR